MPQKHFLLGAIFSIVVYLLFPTFGWNVLIILAASVLIDFDHYMLYIVMKKEFSLKKAYYFFRGVDEEYKKVYKGTDKKFPCIFHTAEFLTIMIVLSIYYNFIFFVTIGFIFHVFTDFYHENFSYRHRPFFLIWWIRRKDAKNIHKYKLSLIFLIAFVLLLFGCYYSGLLSRKYQDYGWETKLICNESVDEEIKRQIESVEDLDTLLVLGGGTIYYHRINYAYQLYKNIEKTKNIPPNIILTGNHSGFCVYYLPEKYSKGKKEILPAPDSEFMKENLVSCGIPAEKIFTENESLDTLVNLIYSKPLLEKINAKKIGLITDDFHMRRGMWGAEKVLEDDYEIYPFPTGVKASVFRILMEDSIYNAQKIDLLISGINMKDYESLEEYLRTKHPIHALREGNKPPISLYNIGIKFYSIVYQIIRR